MTIKLLIGSLLLVCHDLYKAICFHGGIGNFCAWTTMFAFIKLFNCYDDYSFSQSFYILRSTIVHSNTVPAKDQHNFVSYKDRQNPEETYKNSKDSSEAVHVNMSRAMQAPQRIPLGTHSPF